jgi:hypothetical protein
VAKSRGFTGEQNDLADQARDAQAEIGKRARDEDVARIKGEKVDIYG